MTVNLLSLPVFDKMFLFSLDARSLELYWAQGKAIMQLEECLCPLDGKSAATRALNFCTSNQISFGQGNNYSKRKLFAKLVTDFRDILHSHIPFTTIITNITYIRDL